MKKSRIWIWVGRGVLLLASSGCTQLRMAPPADVSSSSEVLSVSDRSHASGSFVNEGFNLGSYKVVDVDRKWDSSSGTSIGPWGKETKTTGFSFTLDTGKAKLKGRCESELKKQSLLALGGSFDWGSTTVACSCDGGGDKGTLILSKAVNKLSLGGTDYPVTQIHSVVGSGDQSAPSGFRADSDEPLGAVEVLYPGQVWLKKDLDEPTRGQVSCLFVGLILYRPPNDN